MKHRILVSQVSMKIVRQLINAIDWEKQLVSIRGSRGVGKTTLMRQYIRQKYGVNAGEALYCVMDSMYFTNHTLLEVAERFHLMGGKHLFLDEVHKYPTWSKEIKEIIDLWPDLKDCRHPQFLYPCRLHGVSCWQKAAHLDGWFSLLNTLAKEKCGRENGFVLDGLSVRLVRDVD